MIDQNPSERSRPRIVKSRLSSEERRAIETVAKLFNKPTSEFYDEDQHDTGVDRESNLTQDSPLEEDDHIHGNSWSTSKLQWQSANTWEQDTAGDVLARTSQLGTPWSDQPSGVVFGESYPTTTFNQWPRGNHQISTNPSIDELDSADYDSTAQSIVHPSPSWSHHTPSEEPWNAVPNGTINISGEPQSPGIIARSLSSSYDPRELQNMGTTDGASNRYSPASPSEPLSSNNIEDGWEDLISQEPNPVGQVARFSGNEMTNYSISEPPTPYQTYVLDKSAPRPVEWVSVDPSEEAVVSRKAKRRGPFQDQQLREETSNTRKLKACLRCRMQKVRCQINTDDPSGVCQTCQDVSIQKIHTLPCMRYKLTECTLYRIGKAPGLEFTFRWPVMKLKDISDWSDTRVRTIKVLSDVCPIPIELSVRKFRPIPEDSMWKSWMDGKTRKFKTTTPYAIVNMNAAKNYLRDYLNDNVFVCMDYWLRDRDELIIQTFNFARSYMRKAPADEQSLLADYFRLWFASRRTATIESIIGDDTLDMEPEMTDRSYPLFGKVPLPPVMIQQLDMILQLGFLQPLRKKVLDQFNRIVLKNHPKSWMTIYLITFMSLQSCAAFTTENYENARKHGLKRRWSMPQFIDSRHHSSNVFLSHYHYCTKPCNPFKLDWRKRQTTQFADMTTDEIDFILRTSEMVKERKDKFRRMIEWEVYEDDLFFVSQMFEDEWSPRDTPIDMSDETIEGGPLKEYGSPKEHDRT